MPPTPTSWGSTRLEDGSLDLYAPVGFEPVMSLTVAPCAQRQRFAGFARKARTVESALA
jgi:hypothetical protein